MYQEVVDSLTGVLYEKAVNAAPLRAGCGEMSVLSPFYLVLRICTRSNNDIAVCKASVD